MGLGLKKWEKFIDFFLFKINKYKSVNDCINRLDISLSVNTVIFIPAGAITSGALDSLIDGDVKWTLTVIGSSDVDVIEIFPSPILTCISYLSVGLTSCFEMVKENKILN